MNRTVIRKAVSVLLTLLLALSVFAGMTITATDEPAPVTPDKPAGKDNTCKWDGKDHGTSFRGRLVKFFHTVLCFFAHLFGLK